jgi:hypothetical protein
MILLIVVLLALIFLMQIKIYSFMKTKWKSIEGIKHEVRYNLSNIDGKISEGYFKKMQEGYDRRSNTPPAHGTIKTP